MELLGRDPQLASAARAIGDVRRGSGRVLGLVGETGLGKSALLAEIGQRARAAGLRVLAGRGSEHERDVPFGVLVDALGEAAGAPGDVPVAERFLRHRAIAARLEDLAPAAVLLDDLHWADDASLELVLHLLRRPVAIPALLVIAARPVGPVARLLDAARGAPGWEQLALEPLAPADALALVGDLADEAVRERVVREGHGNPLFLRELARMADRGDGALPPTLMAAIGLEVASLAPEARALIEGAAVAGEPFDPELAAAVAGLDAAAAPAALDALVAADLVRPAASSAPDGVDGAAGHALAHLGAPGGPPPDLGATPCGRPIDPECMPPATVGRAFVFRHPLVRRAVYDACAPGWRLGAHERAAAALERRGAGPAAQAFHVVRSAHTGDPDAIAVLCAAAEVAGEASPAAAAHWYGAALRFVPDRDHSARAGLLARRALALSGSGRLAEARMALLEGLALSDALELTVACAQVETQLGMHTDARRRLLAARAGAPPEQHAALAFELAAGAFHEGRIAELRGWAEPAVVAAQDDPLLLTGAQALLSLGALWRGDPETARAALDRATAGLDALDDATLASQPAVPTYVGIAQHLNERFAAATRTGTRALEIARRTGQAQLVVTLLGLRAISLTFRLELDAALEAAEAAEEAARLQGVPHLLHFALWIRALVHDVRGEASDADRAVREGSALTAGLEPSKLTRTAACEFAALDEDPLRAMEAMATHAGPLLELVDPTHRTWLLLRMVRAAIAGGELELAEQWAEDAAAHAERLGLAAGAVRAACACAEVVLARGDAAEAAIVAEHACASADMERAPLDALGARLLTGRCLAVAGDERAREVLQRVAGDAGRAGAQAIHEAAGRELRKLGSRVSAPARRAARRSSPLSEREREIAALVAEGRSNKQVAAALFLSEKTIENALTTIYAKLGVRSRVELSLRFHLDGPAGVEQGVDDDHRGRRPDGVEDLAMRRNRSGGVGGRGQQRAGADDVGGRGARFGQRGDDDLPAAASLFGR